MSSLLALDPVLCFGPPISITIKDSGVLLRLPREILSVAPNMAGMFSLTLHNEGSSDKHPIVLTLPAHAAVDDFRAFAFFLLPSLASNITWDVTTWTGVLRIANWAMLDSARDTAIRHLDPVVKTWPPAQLYRFAHEHRVLEWYIHAIRELLCPPESLSVGDIIELGSEIAFRLMNIRLHAERAANVRVYNQMHLHMRGLVQRLYTENGGIMTVNQMNGLLDPMSELALRYRAALPSVLLLQGHRWATEIKDEFVLEHFPVEFI